MVTPYLQEISGLRNNGEFFAYTSGQSNEEHQSRKGSWFPFASRSLEAPGRERPQPPPDHAGDLHEQCPNLDINVEQWLFIASYYLRRRLLLHRESLLLMLSHLALIQQHCVDPCPGSLRSLLHDSSRQIDAYSSLNRFSSRSTNATISESPIATFNEH